MHVKGKYDRILWHPLLPHHCGALDVLELHLADPHVENWNALGAQHGHQSLQLAQLAGLDEDTAVLPLEAGHDPLELRLGLLPELLKAVLCLNNPEPRPSNSSLQARGNDLEAHGAVDRAVARILRPGTRVGHGLRSQEALDGRHDRAGRTRQDDPVTLAQRAVLQEHVGGHASVAPVAGPHLQDDTLKLVLLLQALRQKLLRQAGQQVDEVRHPLASSGARGHQRHGAATVLLLDIPVQATIQAELVELQHPGAKQLTKLICHVLLPL
mmetsp:Transcript_84518/g.247898  ORF Transcript_84518/g.247898 Transcript_84518/m.247898 type:complete len:269 (-) Transcript_84518:1039-1845(-)